MNEFLLILSLLISFSAVLFFHKFFGKSGLFVWICITSIFANIEVSILINAFGLDQTLGNTLFASSFLATDILSELYGKQYAKKGVLLGISTSLLFIIFSISWILYSPSPNDWAMPSIKIIFSKTPQILIFSLLGYTISQNLDVFLYHKIWIITEKKSGNKNKFLWIRNNISTLLSQLLNIIIFNFGAFWNVYSFAQITKITFSCYLIYIFTSILDTPFLYLAKKIKTNSLI